MIELLRTADPCSLLVGAAVGLFVLCVVLALELMDRRVGGRDQ